MFQNINFFWCEQSNNQKETKDFRLGRLFRLIKEFRSLHPPPQKKGDQNNSLAGTALDLYVAILGLSLGIETVPKK